MAHLSSLLRLGIRRGWKIRPSAQSGHYKSSLVHCMFVYLVLRSKAVQHKLWIVNHFVNFTHKKTLVFAFFCYVSGSKKINAAGLVPWRIRVELTKKKYCLKSKTTKIQLRFRPNWIRSKSEVVQVIKIKNNRNHRQGAFKRIWNFGSRLLKFSSREQTIQKIN